MHAKQTPQSPPTFAALLAPGCGGKDTGMTNVISLLPDIGLIHISAILRQQGTITKNPEYKRLVDNGDLLPPEVGFKAFRFKYNLLTDRKIPDDELPHLLCNGGFRALEEAKWEFQLMNRRRGHHYRKYGFHFKVGPSVLRERAEKRCDDFRTKGIEPRKEDTSAGVLHRYNLFAQSIEEMLDIFARNRATIIPIEEGQTREEIAIEIAQVYQPEMDRKTMHQLLTSPVAV